MRARFTPEQAAGIRARLAAGDSRKIVAQAFGCSETTIHWIAHNRDYRVTDEILPGRKWRHIGLVTAQQIKDEWFADPTQSRLDLMYKWRISDITLRNIVNRRGKYEGLN